MSLDQSYYLLYHLFPKRRSNMGMACSGSHSFKDQWAYILAFGGFSGKQSPVGCCTGPCSWSHYFSWCAALIFSAHPTMDRKRGDWHRTRRARKTYMPQNDEWQEHHAAHPWGASDERRRGENSNFSELACRCSCHIWRPGQGRLLLSRPRG